MNADSEFSADELRRLRAAWAELAPSEWEVTAARRRLAFRRDQRRRLRPVAAVTVLACTLAIAGAAYAAVEHYQRRASDAQGSPAGADERPEPRQFVQAPKRGLVAMPKPSASAAEPPPLALDDLPSTQRPAQRPPPPARVEQPAGEPPAETAWQRAARALEDGDRDGAERALSEIEAGSDPEARDAARLARAQLGLAKGDVANARPVLEDLARNGATPLIRRRARAALGNE